MRPHEEPVPGEVRTADQARRLLQRIASLPAEIGERELTFFDDAVGALLSTDSESAWRATRAVAPEALPPVLARLPCEGYAWAHGMRLLATVGTGESVRAWAELFVQSPERDPMDFHSAAAPFTDGDVTENADVLFPRLLDAVDRLDRRAAVVDIANRFLTHGILARHPLVARLDVLEEMIAIAASTEEVDTSDAVTACYALARIEDPAAIPILLRALDADDMDVHLEAAFALACHGDQRGVNALVQACRSHETLSRAQEYLQELELDRLIPDEARSPERQAMAEFSSWLAHPNELGEPPDELEVLDHRTLAWPPSGERREFWLIRYTLYGAGEDCEAETDAGVVGSITFCLFGYKMAERPPEDAYAIHCVWEMEQEGLITIDEPHRRVCPREWIARWPGSPLEGARLLQVATIARELQYGALEVALVSADLNGERGWAVIEGAASDWYPRHEMPEGAPERTVLMLHIGRRLLGFNGRPDRAAHL